MDSADPLRVLMFRWADLPPDLIAIIFRYLQNPTDNTRFRSVCRSWRFSTSPPPNILSPFFPLKLSSQTRIRPHQPKPSPIILNSTAVYLLRPRNDPNSKAWMVSVQESIVGELLLRHALTYEEIASPSGEKSLDLSSEYWIATQIDRSYCYSDICQGCMRFAGSEKVAFVSSSDPNRKIGASGSASGSGASSPVSGTHRPNQLVGLCKSGARRFAFVLGSSGKPLARKSVLNPGDKDINQIVDFVYFNGWIYAVDKSGYIYVFDDQKFQLLQINYRNLRSSLKGVEESQKCLVVSDGDLYMVLRRHFPHKFRIYRLVLMEDGSVMIPRCKWEEVESLGDRVFFFRWDCAFSVSARDLPDPWKGNCVVFVGRTSCDCFATGRGIEVMHLGGHQQPRFQPMSSLQGYSDLFATPSSWL